MADILKNSVFVGPANPETGYSNPEIKPKNTAHKGVKYWYKFRTNIVMDGEGYQVMFNIRDKGKQQYAYLIELKKDGTSGVSNTAVSDLLRTNNQTSQSIDTVSQPDTGVKPSIRSRNTVDTLREQGVPDEAISQARELLADIRTAYGDDGDAARVVQQEIVNFENAGNVPVAQALAALYEETQRGNTVKMRNEGKTSTPGDTEGKSSFRNYVRDENGRLRPMTDDEYETKLNAETHIDELAQVSTRGNKTIPDEGGVHGAFAEKGWNYRPAYFLDFDNQFYRLTLSIAKNNSGNVVYNVEK